MATLWITLGIVAGVTLLILLTAYICFRMAFYVPKKAKIPQEEYPIPPGEIYEPHRDTMIQWMKEVRELPCETVSVRSFDGLTLWGKYYEYQKGAPIELMFHGYRGNAQRDLCGGVQRCFALEHNVLIVDQRAAGNSDGSVITFGVNESRDCLTWIDFMIGHFGENVKIILTGISMGAATVMMAAGRPLPGNVIHILADCGYTTAKAMIIKTIGEMKLPAGLLYPFVKLGAKIYGHFDLEETSPMEAMKNCTVPIIFFHGENDQYVPCEMSMHNYEVCTAPKKLVTVPNAGHGLSYLLDPDGYLKALREFEGDFMGYNSSQVQ